MTFNNLKSIENILIINTLGTKPIDESCFLAL